MEANAAHAGCEASEASLSACNPRDATCVTSRFAFPRASPAAEAKILADIKERLAAGNLISGIKNSQKAVLTGKKGVLVLHAEISPADCVSHLPVLCENNAVPCVFVSSSAQLSGFSCVFLEGSDSAVYEQ